MTLFEMETVVRGIVKVHARLPVAEIHDGQILSRDLGFDSLAFLLTLSDLEDRFRFRFPLEDVDRLRDVSFGELVTLVAAQTARAAPPPHDDALRI